MLSFGAAKGRLGCRESPASSEDAQAALWEMLWEMESPEMPREMASPETSRRCSGGALGCIGATLSVQMVQGGSWGAALKAGWVTRLPLRDVSGQHLSLAGARRAGSRSRGAAPAARAPRRSDSAAACARRAGSLAGRTPGTTRHAGLPPHAVAAASTCARGCPPAGVQSKHARGSKHTKHILC